MRLGVGHVGAVLQVLPGVGKVHAVGVNVPALAGEDEVGGDPHVPSQGDDDVLEGGALGHPHPVVGGVHRRVVPVLDGDHGQVRAGGDVDLHGLGQGGGTDVVQQDGGPGALPGGNEQVLGSRRGGRRVRAASVGSTGVGGAGHGQAHGALQVGAGLDGHRRGGAEGRPGHDAGAVHRLADPAQVRVVAPQGPDRDAVGGVHARPQGPGGLGLPGPGGHGVEVEQRPEAPHGGEAPLLLPPARHREEVGVEGGGAVGAGGDVAWGAVAVGALQGGPRVVGGEIH